MVEQKVAVVLGASRGIGAAIAKTLAGRGFAIALSYREDVSGATETVRLIESSPSAKALSIRADVRSDADVEALFALVKARFGRVDVLVNNVGMAGTAPLEKIERRFLSEVLDVNLKAVIMSSSCALPLFTATGGAILNISSAIATQPLAGQVAYAASKGGIEALTRVLALELGSRKIRVNAIAPGPVDTTMLPADPNMRGWIHSRTPLGRLGQPEDIAKVAAFLVSDDAGWITGQIVAVDGGFRL